MEKLRFNRVIKKYDEWQIAHHDDCFNISQISKNRVVNTEKMFRMLHDIASCADFNLSITLQHTLDKMVVINIIKHPHNKHNRMYTSGCFDIFHYGHLNILKRSKELCNYLIVGVSTDDLILREKGHLPVIPFEERFNVVKAIKYVDEVIPQIDKNKQRIVDEYGIDAISVGDDWKGRFPITTCHVEYFPYTKSVSSTILKETLKIQK
ncbi:MAG: adenylyltransferase/cytidyltransferase family protein [Flavobacteriaceae bacterium]|nr:adenylyltransferase/cytidyltransferase family protein [Flavobacteriaceae bacterium]